MFPARQGRRLLPLALTLACVLLPAARASADTLYLTDRAANVVHQFHVGADGALSALNPPTVATAGVNPTGIAVSPNGRSVYVASAASGGSWFGDVAQYDVFETGALVPKGPFEAFAAANPNSVGAGVAVTGDSRFAYVTGCCSGSFAGTYQFGADANGLLSALTPPFVAAVGATEVVVHPTLARAYVSLGSSGIRRFDVEGDGNLRSANTTSAAGATQLAITPNGRYLYATAGLQDVLAFAVDPADGRLSSLGTVTIPSGTVAYLAASDSSVYVSTTVGVSQYDIGGDGRLTPKTPADFTLRGASPAGIALSPDGRSAYVAGYITPGAGGSILAQYDVGAGGVLTPKAAGSIVVRGTPVEIAVTTAGTGGSAPPPGPPPPPPPAPPAPRVEPPARRNPINEVLLFRREGGRFVGFKWDASGVQTEITCNLSRQSPLWCETGVEIIDLAADNVRVVHFSAARRGRRRPTVLARGRIRLAPGRTGTIRLAFTRAGRRALRGRRSLNAFALVRVKLGSEPPLVGQARARLVRRAPARRRARR